MTILDVWRDGNDFVCAAGAIGCPRTSFHDGCQRMCVHAELPLPRAVLFGKNILGYGFQPVLYLGPCWPAIVSRHHDVVTLAFDREGSTTVCANRPRIPFTPAASWSYVLRPIRWRDDYELSDNVLLGVWPD